MSRIVFKILPTVKGFPGIGYNEKKCKKEKAKLVHFSNFPYSNTDGNFISEKEARNYMERFSERNKRIRHKQFHAIISCKGNTIEQEELLKAGLHITKELGYELNPLLAYLHSDTKNRHLHIISTRVRPDGKKVPHHFEHKRANAILNQYLNINPNEQTRIDIAEVLQYHCTTTAQYRLLLELKGYTVQTSDEGFSIFKHGNLQAKLTNADLEKAMEREYKNNTSQIRALLFKYHKQYNPVLKDIYPRLYENHKPEWASELTDFMRQKFGLHFVFFTAKGHVQPYGYAIIDHKDKVVYKGSEVMKLGILLEKNALLANSKEEIPSTEFSPKEPENLTGKEATHTIQIEKFIPDIPVSAMIHRIENEVEKDIHKEEMPKKKKRGRYI